MNCFRRTFKHIGVPVSLLVLGISGIACSFFAFPPEMWKDRAARAEPVVFGARMHASQLGASPVSASELKNLKNSGLEEKELTVSLAKILAGVEDIRGRMIRSPEEIAAVIVTKTKLERVEKDMEETGEEMRFLMMLTIGLFTLTITIIFGLFAYTLAVMGLARSSSSRNGGRTPPRTPKKKKKILMLGKRNSES